MTTPIIRVEKISKLYHIGQREQMNKTFREAIIESISAPVRNFRNLWNLTRFDPSGENTHDIVDTIWALRDISFDVQSGQVIGIIGSNGAGKSTLLKILSRITEPTSGEACLYGRISSLLEVGTGFHPELTGRENIYLNGSFLGMKRAEINRKFDEIVAFAEVDKFIDTPVKKYSSGMYVRLAFAVAAHLEPEILIVDEVLAVGDTQFQNKCLGKMEEVGKTGRTILFVSHNMAAVSKLCDTAILLDSGRIVHSGDTRDVINAYVQRGESVKVSHRDLRDAPRYHDSCEKIITWISLHRSDKSETTSFLTGEDIIIRIGYLLDHPLSAYCQMNILNYMGDRVIVVHSEHSSTPMNISDEGYIECSIPDNHLLSGDYSIMIDFGKLFPSKQWLDCIPKAVSFSVDIGNYLGGLEWINSQGHGTLAQKSSWTVIKEKSSSRLK